MRKKKLFCRKWLHCADGSQMRVDYFTLEDRGRISGVEIQSLRNGQREEAKAEGLPLVPEKIGELLSLLSRNTVTACALEEIVAEQMNKF